MNFRRFVRVTHRWIGLATSLILAVVGGTGAIMVWPGDYLLRRVAGRFHENLAMGHVGAWIVIVATAGAVLLQVGGLVLWWNRKTIAVSTEKGWRPALIDLHHSAGALGLLLMLALALTGLVMAFVTPQVQAEVRRFIVDLHSARVYPLPIKALYMIGTMGFLVQGVTGVIMWWRPSRNAASITDGR